MGYSRQDYMNKTITHEDYYRSVNKMACLAIRDKDFIARVRTALVQGDKHLNSIPLFIWDEMTAPHIPSIASALRKHGDSYSPAGAVCCLKQAAVDAAQLPDPTTFSFKDIPFTPTESNPDA